MLRMIEPQARRKKPMAAERAKERRDEHKRRHAFTRRLRASAKDAAFLTLRTGQDTAHIICSFQIPCPNLSTDRPLSCQRIDDLFISVKKTKAPCGSHVESKRMFSCSSVSLAICRRTCENRLANRKFRFAPRGRTSRRSQGTREFEIVEPGWISRDEVERSTAELPGP